MALVAFLCQAYSVLKGTHIRWGSSKQFGVLPRYHNLVGYWSTYGFLYAWALASVCFFPAKRGRLTFLLFFMVVVLPSALFLVLAGERKFLIYTVLVPLMVYHYSHKRISAGRAFLLALVLVLFIGFVLYPWIGRYRNMASQDRSLKGSVEALRWAGRPPDLYEAIEQVMHRFPGIDSLAATIKYVPDVEDYQYGRTLLKFFTMMIPQFIFKDKGDYIRLGELFNKDFFGPAFFSDWVLMPVNELYLNFQVPGILIGMFVLGVALKALYVYFRMNASRVTLVLYLFFWMAATNIENDIGLVWGAFLRHVLVLLVVLWVTERGVSPGLGPRFQPGYRLGRLAVRGEGRLR
jgi:hypothetical protein